MDSNRGPLPADGLRRYFISVENPKLTLAGVVRGMLSNDGCQTDNSVRQRYCSKVFLVLRSIAKALHDLHSQGYVHGNLSLVSCAKFDDRWKLTHLLDAKRVDEILSFSTDTYCVPPEALEWGANEGTEGQVVFKHDFVARTSIDIWAFGQVAYETLVGKSLLPGINSEKEEMDPLKVILQWSDANVVEVRRRLELVGIVEPGIDLILQCLSPNEGARPQIDILMQHSCWSCC